MSPSEKIETVGDQFDVEDMMAGFDAVAEIAGQQVVEDVVDDVIVEDVVADKVEEIEEKVVEDVSAAPADIEQNILDEEALLELEIGINRAEAYEAQESKIGAPETDAATAAATSSVAPKRSASGAKTSKVKAAGSVPTPRDLSAVAEEFFQLTQSDAANKAAVIADRPLQKKIAEKFDQLFLTLSVGKRPSTYVEAAFRLLNTTKEMTSTELVAAYKASGLNDGTARSQAGQIMVLFNTVKIADRTGQKLTLRTDSVIAQRLRTIIGLVA